MAKVNKVFPSPYNGISEQIPELMLDSQCLDMVNCVPDLILGLSKRPPAIFKTRIPGLSNETGNGDTEVLVDGWYLMILNSDTYGDYDVNTLSYSGGSFIGANPSNHIVNSNLDLQTTGWYTSNVFKSRVVDSSHLEADRNWLDQGDSTYRCKLTWNKATRTWTRTDASDYYLYPINQSASYSHSLGVCTNDPRFLVQVEAEPHEYDKSGIYAQYPKVGVIWLFAGETL